MSENNYGGRRPNAGPKFKGERVRLSTWVSPETHEKLKAISYLDGTTISKMIPKMLGEYIEEHNINIKDFLNQK